MKKRTRNAVWKLLFFLFLLFGLFAGLAWSRCVTLSWDMPTTNEDGSQCLDLAGVKVYIGTMSGIYEWWYDVNYVITTMICDLEDSNAYYFAVTAYDTSGNESGFSNEVLICSALETPYYCDVNGDGNISASPSGCCDGAICEFDGCQLTPGQDYDDGGQVGNNNLDNNCNGIDENHDGIADNNYVPVAIVCGGNCGLTGQLVCNNGVPESTCPMTDNCALAYYCDDDSDGYVSILPAGYCNGSECFPSECQLTAGSDCNDDYRNINIAAIDDNCDGIDDNCDGIADNDAIFCGSVYVKHLFIPDVDGNGQAEIAVLKTDGVSSMVMIIDSNTGAILSIVWYFNGLSTTAMSLVSYPDINGNGFPEIGVLAYDGDTGQTVYEIKDISTGSLSQDTPPSVPITPDTPTGLTITGVSDTQVVLTWQEAQGATAYNIYRDGQLIGTTFLESFTDDSVEGGLTYTYTVVATNGSQTSGSSAELPVEACYPPARILGGTIAYYSTLQEAYNAVADGGTVQTRAMTPNQSLNANINKTVNIGGGYNCDYSATTCDSSLTGNVFVNSGRVMITECLPDSLTYFKHLYYFDGANLKLAVIGKNKSTNRPYAYIMDVKTGMWEKQIVYFANNYTPLGAAKYVVGSGVLIGILGKDDATGSTSFEIRQVTNGSLY